MVFIYGIRYSNKRGVYYKAENIFAVVAGEILIRNYLTYIVYCVMMNNLTKFRECTVEFLVFNNAPLRIFTAGNKNCCISFIRRHFESINVDDAMDI